MSDAEMEVVAKALYTDYISDREEAEKIAGIAVAALDAHRASQAHVVTTVGELEALQTNAAPIVADGNGNALQWHPAANVTGAWLTTTGGRLDASRVQLPATVLTPAPAPATVTLSPERVQFARDLADPNWCLSVPNEAKDVIRDLLDALLAGHTPVTVTVTREQVLEVLSASVTLPPTAFDDKPWYRAPSHEEQADRIMALLTTPAEKGATE